MRAILAALALFLATPAAATAEQAPDCLSYSPGGDPLALDPEACGEQVERGLEQLCVASGGAVECYNYNGGAACGYLYAPPDEPALNTEYCGEMVEAQARVACFATTELCR